VNLEELVYDSSGIILLRPSPTLSISLYLEAWFTVAVSTADSAGTRRIGLGRYAQNAT